MLLYLNHFIFRHKIVQIITAVILIFNCNNSFSQEYIKIKAEKGAGIYTILKQNGLPPKEYLDLFIELNKTKLGKENALIEGRIYLLPNKAKIDSAIQADMPVKEIVTVKEVNEIKDDEITLPETDVKEIVQKKKKVYERKVNEITLPITDIRKIVPVKNVYDIYGKNYNEITIKNNNLFGTVYYLMSGHGGPDPGAVSFLGGHQLCEDEYAYDVTLRLAHNLTECGATVYMIIRDPNDGIRDEAFLIGDKDEVCYPDQPIPISQLARLQQSTAAVNKLASENKGKFQRLVVIHVDSRSKNENIDVFFYYNIGSKSGENLANILKETIGKRYAKYQPSRGYTGTVSERNLYVIKNSIPTSVFIELGNINHTRDQQRLLVAANRQAVSNWLKDGLIEEYRKTQKVKPAIKSKVSKVKPAIKALVIKQISKTGKKK